MVRLHLFGDLRLEADGSDVALASLSRRPRLLLAILAIERRVHGRSELAGRLWPDVREDSARVSLRTALSQVRAALGPATSHVLRGERDGGVALAAEVRTDLDDVQRLLVAGDPEEALERCSGELLAGLDDDWVLEQRDDLRDRLARGLSGAAAAAESEGRLEDAVRLSRRQVSLDPLSETFGRELIRRLAQAGDRGAAMTAYERLRDRLAEELRLAPSAATRELIHEIRAEPVAEPAPMPVAAPPVARGLFVGREEQLEALAAEWRRARGGERRVVAIAGEPGIGKTRLTAELCATAAADGGLVVVGACHEDALVPYEPFAEVIRRYAAECPEGLLRDRLATHVGALSTLVPALADRIEPSAPPGELGPHRLVEAVVALVHTAAATRPTLVVLEDLHWAEEATAVALRHVVRGTEDSPLLVLLTFRGSEMDDEHPVTGALAEVRRARVLREVALEGLDVDAVGAIVAAEGGAPPPRHLVSAVHARTAGNPFFVEELVRGRADLSAIDLVSLPQSVTDLLARRLHRIDRSGLAILQAAAVIGHEFDLAVLEAATRSTEDDVLAALDDVSSDGTVVPAAGAGRYAFAHALIRETVYESLSAVRRARLHAAVGAALEQLAPANDGSRSAALAHHFSAAGDHERAIVHHLAAARAAGLLGALQTGLGHCDAALASARAAGASTDAALLAAIGLERGAVLHIVSRESDAVPTLEQALAGARAAGDDALETEVLVELATALRTVDLARALNVHEAALSLAQRRGDVRHEVVALSRSVFVLSDGLRLDRAAEHAQRAVELARPLGDERLVAEALDASKHVAWQLGDADRLAEATAEMEPIQRRNRVLWQLSFTLLEGAYAPLAALRYSEARSRFGEALAIAERMDAFIIAALVLDALAAVEEAQGAPEAGLEACRRAADLMERAGSVGLIGWVEATAGLILVRLRAVELAGERLEHGLATAERAGSRHEVLRCSAFLARARWLAGDPEGALALAERAEALCHSIVTPPGFALLYVAPAMACAADVLTAAGEAARAESLLRGPSEAAARPDRTWYAIPLSMAAARCLLAQERVEAAAAALAPALRAWEDGAFAPGWEAAVLQAGIELASGRAGEAERRSKQARAAVRALAGRLTDPVLREGLLAGAEREIAAYASATSQVTS